MTTKDRQQLAALVMAQRRRKFRTKAAAYKAARLNSATWDRIEDGQSVRDDRLAAAVDALWPATGGDWRSVLDQDPIGRPDSTTASPVEYIDARDALKGWLDDGGERSPTPPTISLRLFGTQQLAEELTRQVVELEDLLADAAQQAAEAAETAGDLVTLPDRLSTRSASTDAESGSGSQRVSERTKEAAYPETGESQGHAVRRHQNEAAEAPDAPGPEHGA